MQINLANMPVITISLALVNAGIFAVGLISNTQNKIIADYGFIPDQLFHNTGGMGDAASSESQSFSSGVIAALGRLFSSMFVHANVVHISFNLFALVYIGGSAEKSIGALRYFSIYILAGLAGALLYGALASFVTGNGGGVLIGASGAISGVLGIAAAMGNTNAYYWLIMQIVFAVISSFTNIAPIAFTAHIGGFITGLLMARLVLELERKKRGLNGGYEDGWRQKWR